MRGSEALVQLLQQHGVTHIFGLCGDTSLEFYRVLEQDLHGMRHILTRDERSASYMADAFAKVSGRVGVCEGPSGGGATYITPGVAEANLSSNALLAITSDISVGGRDRFTLTDFDQESFFGPITKWSRVIPLAEKVPETVRAAFRHATSNNPGAVHLGFPMDVLEGEVHESDVYANPEMGSFPSGRQAPDPGAVREAAARLVSAKAPVLVVGGGVLIAQATEELRALAEALQAPVVNSVSGKNTLPHHHPLNGGTVGSNGGLPPAAQLVTDADLVAFIGCRAGSVTTWKWKLPPPHEQTIVHVDADPTLIGTNYRTHAAVVGDARLAG